jgi:hypothetical protein
VRKKSKCRCFGPLPRAAIESDDATLPNQSRTVESGPQKDPAAQKVPRTFRRTFENDRKKQEMPHSILRDRLTAVVVCFKSRASDSERRPNYFIEFFERFRRETVRNFETVDERFETDFSESFILTFQTRTHVACSVSRFLSSQLLWTGAPTWKDAPTLNIEVILPGTAGHWRYWQRSIVGQTRDGFLGTRSSPEYCEHSGREGF